MRRAKSDPRYKAYPRNYSANTRIEQSGKSKAYYAAKRFEHWADNLTFTIWDGEGITDAEGIHRYVLLMNTDGLRIQNEIGLSTVQVLDTFLDHAKTHPHTINCIFSGNYDINMILKDIDVPALQVLWHTHRLEWGKYTIEYKTRKEFVVKLYNREMIDGKMHYGLMPDGTSHWKRDKDGKLLPPIPLATFRLWDVWGFYQSSLVKAMDTWLAPEDKRGLDSIASMKGERDTFSWQNIDEIARYCSAELAATHVMMKHLAKALQSAQLHITRWDGAGSIAGTIYRTHNVKQYMDKSVIAPVHVYAKHAYFGGRIEIGQYGNYRGKVYTYDIRSAYPSVIANLPALNAGNWEKVSTFHPDTFSIYQVEWDSRNLSDVLSPRFNPFPYRTATNRVIYPGKGKGMYWAPEVASALRHDYPCKIVDGYVWHPDNPDARPFSFVPEYYRLRTLLKSQGDAAQIVLKLGLNSLYGKMAQQIGGTGTLIPPYHQLEWAGYVTGATRARLYDAVMQSPDSIVHLATDGIVSTVPLNLPCGPELGQWEYGEYEGILEVKAGIYWLYGKDGMVQVEHYRGYERNTLKPDDVLQAWSHNQMAVYVPITRFVTLGRALTSQEQFKLWRTWHTDNRKVQITHMPHLKLKRQDDMESWVFMGECHPAHGLVPTLPIDYESEDISKPFTLGWDRDDLFYTDPAIPGVPWSIIHFEEHTSFD